MPDFRQRPCRYIRNRRNILDNVFNMLASILLSYISPFRSMAAIINETVRLFWPTISTTRSFERRDLLFPARKCGDATLCLQRTISSAQTSIVMDYRTPLETMVMGDMGAFLGGWTFSCSIWWTKSIPSRTTPKAAYRSSAQPASRAVWIKNLESTLPS